MKRIPAGTTITVAAMAAGLLTMKNLTQHRMAISDKNRIMPRPVEQIHAISTQWRSSSWGDSWQAKSELGDCGPQLTASILGKMHVLIIRATRWTTTSKVVHIANTMRSASGIFVFWLSSESIEISTIATWSWCRET